MLIREMNAWDVEKAAELMLGVVLEPPFSYEFMDADKAARYIGDTVRTPGFMGFACEGGEGLCAFCLGLFCDYFSEPYYEIKEIFVRRDLQSRGLGGALLKFAENFARESGAVSVTLSTSTAIPAYGFYLKNGYEAADTVAYMHKIIL